MLFLFFFLL
jgi:hypothetical protein